MNGLSKMYGDEMSFYDLDSTSGEGKAKMREFGMLYHGYAVLDRWGGLYWHSAGHQFTAEELEEKIQEALAVPPPN